MSSHSQPQKSAKPSTRAMRKTLDTALPLVGTLIILGISVAWQDMQSFVWIAVGILLIEVSLMTILHKMIPEQRKYNALRAQTNQFLALVRQLNSATLRAKEYDTFQNREVVEDIRSKMLRKVDRLVEVAGKTDGELKVVPLLKQNIALSKAAS